MEQRRLGTQGLVLAALGLGCMGMSWAYGEPDDAESIATLHEAIERGCTFLDTAVAYGPWKNEELLGPALAGKRTATPTTGGATRASRARTSTPT